MKRHEHIRLFVEAIWEWFPRHKRCLPWRDLRIEDDTERAYPILVSEVMLQQTQVPRVVIIFNRFVEEFDTLDALAGATNKEVILAWRGMGYNSRALRLRDAARVIRERWNGQFPSGMDDLLSIKGIGAYTAAAIRNFAFDLPTPCLDTNIRRILHRTFYGPENADGTWPVDDKKLLFLAAKVLESALSSQLSARRSSDWHAALMDFGSLICTKRSPKWEICPLTARGIMKAAYRVPDARHETRDTRLETREPGRIVGSRFTPNRIIRGKIVEALRDAQRGLSLDMLGREVCMDWTRQHEAWLKKLLQDLVRDDLLTQKGAKYLLS